MPPHIELLDLGSAIADVLAFLGPADQHKLRCTSAAMCEWFDSAAENGSLAFFVTFAPPCAAAPAPLRWRHATADPRGAGPEHEGSDADSCPTPPQAAILSEQEANHATPLATVTVHARNYCLSTLNVQAGSEADDAIIDNAAIELVDDFAFEHKLVVTGLFGIRSVGDGFCMGVKAVEVEFRGEGSELRSVGSEWMSYCANLRSVTFAGFGALEEVGHYWLSECSYLDCIAFAGGMPNLKKVGDFWMTQCVNLRQVDLTGFTALEEVGHYWLLDCSHLEGISFAADMLNLRKVGSYWMSSCEKLKHVDLTGCTALEEVGHYWLSSSSSLENITFAADMPKLRKVGWNWMASCPKLEQVDLTGFTALEQVGDGWLRACPSLECVMLHAYMPKLIRVGCSWTPQSGCSLSDHLLQLSKLGLEC